MNYTRRILDRLRDSDSDKTLEEIYAGQDAVLEKITARRKNIVQTRKALKSAVNTLHFENMPMGKEIIDDESMVSFVNETLSKCSELKNQ